MATSTEASTTTEMSTTEAQTSTEHRPLDESDLLCRVCQETVPAPPSFYLLGLQDPPVLQRVCRKDKERDLPLVSGSGQQTSSSRQTRPRQRARQSPCGDLPRKLRRELPICGFDQTLPELFRAEVPAL